MFYILAPKFEYQSIAYGLFTSTKAAEDFSKHYELTDSHQLCGVSRDMNPTVVKSV